MDCLTYATPQLTRDGGLDQLLEFPLSSYSPLEGLIAHTVNALGSQTDAFANDVEMKEENNFGPRIGHDWQDASPPLCAMQEDQCTHHDDISVMPIVSFAKDNNLNNMSRVLHFPDSHESRAVSSAVAYSWDNPFYGNSLIRNGIWANSEGWNGRSMNIDSRAECEGGTDPHLGGAGLSSSSSAHVTPPQPHQTFWCAVSEENVLRYFQR